MKVAGYIRVSDQKFNTVGLRLQDINRQKDKITKFSESMDWGIPIFFCDDGISAFKEDYNSRPDFCRLLREISANRVKRVIVEDLTRWSRRIEDGLKTMKEVSEKATVTSMAEGEVYITTPEGWFKCSIAFLMAEWASRISAYKVKSGMDRRRDNKEKICESCGVVHLGRHPLSCNCKICKQKRVGKEKYKKMKENKGVF
jgi:DNA invertase Pin-like site-specific DNA recombinase